MDTPTRCPDCHAPIAADAPFRRCDDCGSDLVWRLQHDDADRSFMTLPSAVTFRAGGQPQTLADGEWLADAAGDRWRVRFGHVDVIGRQWVTLVRASDLAYRDDTAGGILDLISERTLTRVVCCDHGLLSIDGCPHCERARDPS